MPEVDLEQQLIEWERELHQPATRRQRERLCQLLYAEFEEFGRSGRRYNRQEILDELVAESTFPKIHSEGFSCHVLSPSLVLIHYVSAHIDDSGALHRHTRRTSLWQHAASGWQLRFHQGTALPED